jgi:hypothetical protein
MGNMDGEFGLVIRMERPRGEEYLLENFFSTENINILNSIISSQREKPQRLGNILLDDRSNPVSRSPIAYHMRRPKQRV